MPATLADRALSPLGVDVPGGLEGTGAAVLLQLRLPRVVLAALVGAGLAVSGAAYQGVFRNPLADPYLLGTAADVMARLELTGLAGRTVATLSGGEQQRALLARALAQRPRVLLLDEPTSALDLGHAQQVLDLVDRLRRQDGLTLLSTVHALTLAGQYADRLALLPQGRVVAEGTPAQVLTAGALAGDYGARAQVVAGPHGPAVLPLRAPGHDRG